MTTPRKLPSRLHHTAYTTKDMEKTRTVPRIPNPSARHAMTRTMRSGEACLP